MTIFLILAVSDTIPQKSAPPGAPAPIFPTLEIGMFPENKILLAVSNT
jgi:hypothetical protein